VTLRSAWPSLAAADHATFDICAAGNFILSTNKIYTYVSKKSHFIFQFRKGSANALMLSGFSTSIKVKNQSQLVKTMQYTAFYKEIQLMLNINDFKLLARPSTIFSVPHVALWEQSLPTPAIDSRSSVWPRPVSTGAHNGQTTHWLQRGDVHVKDYVKPTLYAQYFIEFYGGVFTADMLISQSRNRRCYNSINDGFVLFKCASKLLPSDTRTSMYNPRTLELKQLNGIQKSLFLLFTPNGIGICVGFTLFVHLWVTLVIISMS